MKVLTGFLASASLAAPLAWAVNMQLSQILPYADCVKPVPSLTIVSMAALVIGVAGAMASRVAMRTTERTTVRFLAGLGAGSAAMFVFALALQLAATLVISGCQR